MLVCLISQLTFLLFSECTSRSLPTVDNQAKAGIPTKAAAVATTRARLMEADTAVTKAGNPPTEGRSTARPDVTAKEVVTARKEMEAPKEDQKGVTERLRANTAATKVVTEDSKEDTVVPKEVLVHREIITDRLKDTGHPQEVMDPLKVDTVDHWKVVTGHQEEITVHPKEDMEHQKEETTVHQAVITDLSPVQ